jgi:sulfite dehydrogenase (cytochrome) subunit B
MRSIFAVCAIAILAGTAFAAEKPVILKNGKGKETLENVCSGCHSLDYIRINAPFLSRQTWTAEVDKMIKVYGAPVSDADAAVIIDYLSANYGQTGA